MASPLAQKQLLQLVRLGIPADKLKFQNVNLQSAKYVCVNEGAKVAVVTIDGGNILRLPVTVDSAIMNPVSKVIALRVGQALRILNLEMQTTMKETTMDGVVAYWKWLDSKTVAIVTDKATFHWSMDGDAQPVKMFDRAPSSGPVQILNYQASVDRKWLILGGITKGAKGIEGVLQVYSVDMKASQPTMDSHGACFASVKIDGRDAPSTLFCFTKDTPEGPRLNMIEVGVPKANAFTQSAVLKFQPNDFPIGVVADNKVGFLFVVTKAGFVLMYDIQSGQPIFVKQVSNATVFAQVSNENNEGGVIIVDNAGVVTQLSIDTQNVVGYVCNTLNQYDLGVKLATRNNWPGAGGIFKTQFDKLMAENELQKAMQLAASSPQGILRTSETIEQLKKAGGQHLLQYFQLLLGQGSLNAIESVGLVGPIVQRQNAAGLEHIKGWLKDNKLEASEELGDVLKGANVTIALSVYLRAKVPQKVISCFMTLAAQEANAEAAYEHLKNIIAYADRVGFSPEYPLLIGQLASVNADRAKDLTLLLIQHEDGAKVEIQATVKAFMDQNDVKNTTNILLEWLKPRGDLEEDSELQTTLLEINLLQMPQVAEAIMESPEYQFTHYDKPKIAALCERAHLYGRALEHYTDMADIKRVLTNCHLIKAEYLLEYFGRLSPENSIELLRDILTFNLQQNIRLVVEIAKKWSSFMGSDTLIQLFEEFKSFNGIYFYLGSFVNDTEDPAVVFKYIEAAVQLNQFKEVERVCRDNNHYDPKEVKEYLLQKGLKDPRPLIHVCDRFGFVDELTQYLYTNNLYMFIEAYVQRMNIKATAPVIGQLLDMNVEEEKITALLANVRPPPDAPEFVNDLVEAVETRNRLKMLRPFLEARNQEGSEDVGVHNGLAKIYVDVNNNPKSFLTTNRFYDSKSVGSFCESRDPMLAFIAYKRAWGPCDDELVAISNKHGFFKDQARYLVERQDADLWAKVLMEENEFRKQLIAQVVATALPESTIPEEVSNTVKAFMEANLPNELIELLEKIILHAGANSDMASNKNLQNLLILTAIKADQQRVMDYVKRLDNYEGADIAKIALSDQYNLYEEAFFIYKKFKLGADAIGVLLDHMEDIPRAQEFAEYLDQPDVWSLLAKSQLQNELVQDAIKSFLKAQDHSCFQEVLVAAKSASFFDELIDYIHMVRSKVRDSMIDNELIYCLAKTEKITELEEFIAGSHVAKLGQAGDRCYEEGLYEAAKILYGKINNNGKLALCFVKLLQFQEAVQTAEKANSIPTWKAVCFACVDAKEFRLAQICGLNIIVMMDHLLDLVRYYERFAYFNELISLLEQGINLDRAHIGMFTQLGVLYCKYKEDKIMDHVKMFWSKLSIPTVLAACQENCHYEASVFLYRHYEQFENAADVMMENNGAFFQHDLFKETMKQVANMEALYKAIEFYGENYPLQLNDMLMDMVTRLDHSRVVVLLRRLRFLPLAKKYLLHVQHDDVDTINEAVNEMAIEEDDFKALRKSVYQHEQFDQIALAQKLESNPLIEFRRISSHLYRTNGRFDKAVELSKKDNIWADTMETTAESGDQEGAEKLLEFFVKEGELECFAALLYTCYELIRPDVVLELAWQHGLKDLCMPYMIQTFHGYSQSMNRITSKFAAADEVQKAAEDAQRQVDEENMGMQAAYVGAPASYSATMMPLAITAGPGYGGGYPQQHPQQQPYR